MAGSCQKDSLMPSQDFILISFPLGVVGTFSKLRRYYADSRLPPPPSTKADIGKHMFLRPESNLKKEIRPKNWKRKFLEVSTTKSVLDGTEQIPRICFSQNRDIGKNVFSNHIFYSTSSPRVHSTPTNFFNSPSASRSAFASESRETDRWVGSSQGRCLTVALSCCWCS